MSLSRERRLLIPIGLTWLVKAEIARSLKVTPDSPVKSAYQNEPSFERLVQSSYKTGLTAQQFGRLVRCHLLRNTQKRTLLASPVCREDRPPLVRAEPAIIGDCSRCERIRSVLSGMPDMDLYPGTVVPGRYVKTAVSVSHPLKVSIPP